MHVRSTGNSQITITLRCLNPAYVLGGALRRFPPGSKVGVPVAPTTRTPGMYTWTVPAGAMFYKVDAVADPLATGGGTPPQVWFEVRAEQNGAAMAVVTSTPNPERKLGRDVVNKGGNPTGQKYKDFVVNVVR